MEALSGWLLVLVVLWLLGWFDGLPALWNRRRLMWREFKAEWKRED